MSDSVVRSAMKVGATSEASLSRRVLLGAVAFGIVGVLAVGWREAIWPLNQGSAKALERRAQLFWDLRISGDTLGAYGYTTEAYRRRVSADGFSRSRGPVVWTAAKVKGVTIDENGGLVDVDLTYRLQKEGFERLESTGRVRERWILEKGSWYRWPTEMGG